MKRNYQGWIVVESAGQGMRDYVFVEWSDGNKRQRCEMESRGESGCISALEWWEKKVGSRVYIESAFRGCYRVYTKRG